MIGANECYDCIEHTYTIFILMYFGVPLSVTTTLFLLLQQDQHSTESRYRVPEPVYDNKQTAIASIGQGKSLGPALWVLLWP